MPIQHKNRRGQTFYLHQGKTKSEKATYFFSLKAEGNTVNKIPEGYEVYENPNAQVFLRRKQPKIITDQELALVEKGMAQYSDVKDYIIDRRKNAIVVYLADQDVDLFEAILPDLFGIAFLLCLVLIFAGIAWAKEGYRLTYESQLRRLSPCPKCGGRLVDGEYSGGNNTHYFLYCEKCGGNFPR